VTELSRNMSSSAEEFWKRETRQIYTASGRPEPAAIRVSVEDARKCKNGKGGYLDVKCRVYRRHVSELTCEVSSSSETLWKRKTRQTDTGSGWP
jgi:hypothetical protein